MRDYSKVIEVLRRAGRPLCAFEFADEPSPGGDSSCQPQSARAWVGETESTIARRLREASRLGLVVSSKRPTSKGVMMVQYALPQPLEASHDTE